MPGGNPDSTQGRAFSVRTLGQGVPFAQHLAQQQNPQPGQPSQAGQPNPQHQSLGGAGRRRKLAAPPEGERATAAGARTPTPRTGSRDSTAPPRPSSPPPRAPAPVS
ncbi:hypothetical protein ACN24K_09100 [Streptomyces microflavus]